MELIDFVQRQITNFEYFNEMFIVTVFLLIVGFQTIETSEKKNKYVEYFNKIKIPLLTISLIVFLYPLGNETSFSQMELPLW